MIILHLVQQEVATYEAETNEHINREIMIHEFTIEYALEYTSISGVGGHWTVRTNHHVSL